MSMKQQSSNWKQCELQQLSSNFCTKWNTQVQFWKKASTGTQIKKKAAIRPAGQLHYKLTSFHEGN